jgi:hypothetical protein
MLVATRKMMRGHATLQHIYIEHGQTTSRDKVESETRELPDMSVVNRNPTLVSGREALVRFGSE